MFSNIEEMKNQGNTAWLFAVLQDYKDDSEKGWMARLDAAEALVQLGDPRGLDYLHEMAKSPNKDIQGIALEILDGLKDYPVEPIVQVESAVMPKSESMFFKINSKYPYLVAWAAFVVLYFIVVTILNPVITLFFVATQSWLSERISSLVSYLLLLIFGFFVFRYAIKLFVLPYASKR
jgi:hypothetical protein